MEIKLKAILMQLYLGTQRSKDCILIFDSMFVAGTGLLMGGTYFYSQSVSADDKKEEKVSLNGDFKKVKIRLD